MLLKITPFVVVYDSLMYAFWPLSLQTDILRGLTDFLCHFYDRMSDGNLKFNIADQTWLLFLFLNLILSHHLYFSKLYHPPWLCPTAADFGFLSLHCWSVCLPLPCSWSALAGCHRSRVLQACFWFCWSSAVSCSQIALGAVASIRPAVL